MLNVSQVRARIAKRERRCDDRPGAFPSVIIRGTCPGWRVVDRGPRALLEPCGTCNMLQPERLHVGLEHVVLLPEATEARAQRERLLDANRLARATTVHVRPYGGSLAAACGKRYGTTPRGRRRHVFAPGILDLSPIDVLIENGASCAECIRIAGMTVSQRAAEKETLRDMFSRMSGAEKYDRDGRRSWCGIAVEMMRDEAQTATDMIEQRSAPETDLERELLARVLVFSVVAYKHEFSRSRGDNLWVWDMDNTRRSIGNKVCRFCRAVLQRDAPRASDHTMCGNTAEVSGHTVRCALKYLAGDRAPKINPEAIAEREAAMLEEQLQESLLEEFRT